MCCTEMAASSSWCGRRCTRGVRGSQSSADALFRTLHHKSSRSIGGFAMPLQCCRRGPHAAGCHACGKKTSYTEQQSRIQLFSDEISVGLVSVPATRHTDVHVAVICAQARTCASLACTHLALILKPRICEHDSLFVGPSAVGYLLDACSSHTGMCAGRCVPLVFHGEYRL